MSTFNLSEAEQKTENVAFFVFVDLMVRTEFYTKFCWDSCDHSPKQNFKRLARIAIH
jgi:hypothetical protein